jgi:hypothetical protein
MNENADPKVSVEAHYAIVDASALAARDVGAGRRSFSAPLPLP